MSLKLIQNQNQFPVVHSWPVSLDAGYAQGPRLPLSPGGLAAPRGLSSPLTFPPPSLRVVLPQPPGRLAQEPSAGCRGRLRRASAWLAALRLPS